MTSIPLDLAGGARGVGVRFNMVSPSMTDPKIAATQINLHKSIEASAQFTRNFSKVHTGIAMVQEPWLHEASIRGISNAGRVFVAPVQRPRTCILVRGLEAELVPRHTSRDLTTVQVRVKDRFGNPKVIYVCSAYLHGREAVPNQALRGLMEDGSMRGKELLIGCDTNSHHFAWGSKSCDERGYDLMEFLDSWDLDIANRGTTPTFSTGRGQTVIDVTFGSRNLINSVRDWRVSGEASLSDHRYVTFWLEGQGSEPAHFRNPRKTDWVMYGESLKGHLTDFPRHYGTPEEVETAVLHIERAMLLSYERSCPLSKRSGKKGDSWWNKDLEKLKKKVRGLSRKYKRDPQRFREEYLSSLSAYKKQIRRRRTEGWRDFCNEVEKVSEASRLFRVLSKGKDLVSGWIKSSEGVYPETSEENLDILLKEHFPDFTQDVPADVLACTRGAGTVDWRTAQRVVSFGRVAWAVESFAPYKSPGPDGILPVLLQKGLRVLEGPLTKVCRACIALGYVPVKWRMSRVAFIPKPGRMGHSTAKDFRPISLMSFVLKMLERLVDRFMEEELEKKPLSVAQHAYRKGRSTDTALHRVVGYIETGMRGRGAVLAVFIDIVGAFNNTPYRAIKTGAKRHRVNRTILRWLKELLTKRMITSGQDFGRVTGRVARGCPQGGVLSPKLWCLAVDGLLEELRLSGVEVVGYSDDIALLIGGDRLENLSSRMDRALCIVERWCRRNGLSVNPDKTECVLFTRRRKLEGFRAPLFYGRPLVLSQQVKYLGIVLDSKLNWSAHAEHVAKKFLNGYWLCKRTIGLKWGLKPSMIRWLYETVLKPRVTYGAVVWWPRVKLVTSSAMFERMQSLLLRGMVSAYKTTPRAALFVAAGIPPLHVEVERAALRTAARLKVLGEWRGGRGGHEAIAGEPCVNVLQADSDRIVEDLIFEKRFTVSATSRDEWSEGRHPLLGDTWTWFTDGSKQNGNTGSAAWDPIGRKSLIGSAGPDATVFQAEILAIDMCAKHLLAYRHCRQNISICCDSWAALGALSSCSTVSRLVRDCKRTLNALGRHNSVKLYWVPAHVGVPGNEKADELAKYGTRLSEPTHKVGAPWCDTVMAISRWLVDKSLSAWNGVEGCRQSKANFGIDPFYRHHADLMSLRRDEARLVVGWMTGQCHFNRHVRLTRVATRTCRFCDEEIETTEHIMWFCPAVEGPRKRHLGFPMRALHEAVPFNPTDLLKFIRALELDRTEEEG